MKRQPPLILFMFPGVGDHYVNMAQQLYEMEPVFHECVDQCAQLLSPLLGLDMREIIYPPKGQKQDNMQACSSSAAPQREDVFRSLLHRDRGPTDTSGQKLYQTLFAQPAVFMIDYALARLWLSWGIKPAAMIGYSIGEYVSARLAGVFSLQEALMLIAKRAQMIQELPGGAMLAVALSEEEIRPFLGETLSLAAINGVSMSVVAGPVDATKELEHVLGEKRIAYSRLQTSHAFHSKMMKPIEKPFMELVKTVHLNPPRIPYISNVTGTWITAEQATDPLYWAGHMCQTVRFADGLRELWQYTEGILLEVGPGQMLGSLARQYSLIAKTTNHIVLASLRSAHDKQSEKEFLLYTLGQLRLAGIEIDWLNCYAYEQHRILPNEKQHYSIGALEQSNIRGKSRRERLRKRGGR